MIRLVILIKKNKNKKKRRKRFEEEIPFSTGPLAHHGTDPFPSATSVSIYFGSEADKRGITKMLSRSGTRFDRQLEAAVSSEMERFRKSFKSARHLR